MNSYDMNFDSIGIFRLHPYLKPFVGNSYDEYKVLHIGESHYIHQTLEDEKYNIEHFKQWWNNPCDEVLSESNGWVDTRQVISNYMNDIKGAYSIFNNFVKSFSKVVLKNPISNISASDKQLYDYLAFMNFFQMPSIHEGKKYWDSLLASAKKAGNKELAYEAWDITVRHSVETVDKVIDILNPQAVVFTSISAGTAYRKANGQYIDDERIIYTSHPAYPFTWNKPLSSLGGKTGQTVMEEGLARLFG